MIHVVKLPGRAIPAVVLAALVALAAGLVNRPALSDSVPGAGPAPLVHGVHNDTTTPFNLVDLPALIAHRFDGHALTVTGVLHRERRFVRQAIAYRGDGLRLTGTLALPRAAGRRPVVVVAHGWAQAGRYRRGGGLLREETALARAGFVVLHPDYRNYGGSAVESGRPVARPVGYPADVINAVLALESADLPQVDPHRIGLLGRSMGGGVALQAAVARPGLFRAIELYSPVSSWAPDDFRRFAAHHPDLRERVVSTFGSPSTRPVLWSRMSSRAYFDRIHVPVQIDHGTADPTCPFAWSVATARALRASGVRTTLVPYAGEQHRFHRLWPRFRHTMLAYFRTHL